MEIGRNVCGLLILMIVACAPSKPVASSTTDHRLHDIWVLKELNGRKLTQNDYTREAPRIELNTNEGKIMGNTGCNNFFGGFATQGDKIIFSNLGSTKMFCEKSVE